MTLAARLSVFQRPTGGAPLAALRVLSGLCLLGVVALLWANAEALFQRPKFFFSYPGLSWLAPGPGQLLFGQLGLMGAAAVAVALGLFYRWACAVYLLGAASLFFLDRTHYQDVLYLALAFSFMMALLPAHRRWSVDARRGAAAGGGSVPLWAPLAAAAMLLALLLSAVLALLAAYEPGDATLIEQLRLAGVHPALLALMFSTTGLLILIAPMRWPASDGDGAGGEPPPSRRRITAAVAAVLLLGHVLLPLRTLVERGNTGWLDADLRPLVAQDCASIFNVRDPASGRRWNVHPGTRLNARQMMALAREPELIRQFAGHLTEHFAAPKYQASNVSVRARVKCAQDDRHYALVLDAGLDLARTTRAELLDARIPFDPDGPHRFDLKGETPP